MTRDGFTILAMGYTGEKAMKFKKAYIAAFNEIERKLAPRNYKAALLALIAKEDEREALEAQNAGMARLVCALEKRGDAQ